MNTFSSQHRVDSSAAAGMDSPEGLYDAWTAAMESRDVERVLACYEKDAATLWGTLAVELKKGHDEIRTYFDLFLDRCSLEIKTCDLHVRSAAPGIAIANGAYQFTLGGESESDPANTVAARFSFVFRWQEEAGSWRIIDHHSSGFPANPRGGKDS